MKLIIEAGGTKCKFGLINQSECIEFETEGFNPNSSPIQLLAELLEKFDVVNTQLDKIDAVFYFGAGCGNESNRLKVNSTLHARFKGAKQIKVTSDLEGTAIATLKNDKGIAAILGTGASAGIYNGKIIEVTSPSLGYLLGDEGSGAYLGRELTKRIIRKELEGELIQKFEEQFKINKEQIISDLYSSTSPNAYLAKFVPFYTGNIDNPAIEQILTGAFLLFFEKHIKPLTSNGHTQKIAIVGGIAFQFNYLLTKIIETRYQHELIIYKDAFSELVKLKLG
jgi:glucosamine kinase